MADDVKKVEYPKCECTNVKNRSWIFWLIFLAMIGYLVYFIITTVNSILDDPTQFFPDGMEEMIGLMVSMR